MNVRLIDRYIKTLRRRGQAIAQQTAAIVLLIQKSPADLSAVLGPALLMAQGVARGQVEVLAWVMSDPDFPSQRLNFQGHVANQAVLWTDLWAALANVSFGARLQNIDSLLSGPPGASVFGANQRGVAIGTAIENIVSPAVASGITFATFWNHTADGRAALGRLLAMDVTLTRDYDFAPLDEALLVLGALVPVVPDPLVIIRRVETTGPNVHEPVARNALTRIVTQGMDLAALAQNTLGSADLWRDIAAFNGLRYPYVSDDPVVQFGDAQGATTLVQPVASGGDTVHLTDALLASVLYPDQRILLDNGAGTTEIVTVVSLADGDAVRITSPNNGYVAGAVVTVYPPVYEVTGRVLKTGDTLMVPVAESSATSGIVVVRDQGGDPAQLYGTDVRIQDPGFLAVTAEGDFSITRGIPNLQQALRNRFKTEKGSLPYHPTYGFGLEAFIGYRHTGFFNFLAVVEGKQTVLRDPRISRVDNFDATATADTITMRFDALTKRSQQFPASVVSPVRG